MKKQIHLNDARRIVDTGTPVDLLLWDSNGDILEYKQVRCTSSYFRGGTRNFVFPNRQVRTVRDVCIFGLNGMEVYL